MTFTVNFSKIFYDDYYPGTLWTKSNYIKIYWTDKDSSLPVYGTSGVSAKSFSDNQLAIAKSAFADWGSVLNNVDFEYTTDANKAQIFTGWTSISTWGYWTSSWSNFIRYTATLELNSKLELTSLSSSANLKHTLLHEIGNILGLGDILQSEKITSVMTDPFTGIDGYLSSNDIQFIKFLYNDSGLNEPLYYLFDTLESSWTEGSTVVFNVTAINIPAGTSVAYSLTGLTAADLVNGTLTGNVTIGTDGKAKIYIPILADNITEGDETLTVTLQDKRASTLVKDTSISLDTVSPTILLTSSKTSLASTDSVTLTFTLSESSTNFVASDLVITGGSISNFNGSGTSYTALFKPTTGATTATISVPNGAFTDTAGNANADGSELNNQIKLFIATDSKYETHTLSVIVDRGILGASAIFLKGLTEKMTLINGVISTHTIEYAGSTFDYKQIDALITTVVRDGEFSEEFKKELTDALPSTSSLTYKDAVLLVGVNNIDNQLITIAGLDGSYVS
jgi:hypothetical protein